MEQATDFLTESDTLAAILHDLDDQAWDRPTQFKGWTINDVLVHLHFWNRAADQSLTDPDGFQDTMRSAIAASAVSGMRAVENAAVNERSSELLAVWQGLYRDMGSRWALLDPKQRVKWVGPEMSVRSSMTARQMETWAHGHEIFDLLGKKRQDTDRIRNIVVLGVKTFGWTFKVHGMAAPEQMPFLRLFAPSGAVWDYGNPDQADHIEGQAVDFAQVVTQTRHVADTQLSVRGPIATQWMTHAQCFAGPPETPPAPGTRFRRET
tara:strand:- start:71778 stop:72572 length:795 start_codon:yes stop_codon:yes gene_type:complete